MKTRRTSKGVRKDYVIGVLVLVLEHKPAALFQTREQGAY